MFTIRYTVSTDPSSHSPKSVYAIISTEQVSPYHYTIYNVNWI